MTRLSQPIVNPLFLVAVVCFQVSGTHSVAQRPNSIGSNPFRAIGISCHDGDTCTIRNDKGERFHVRLFGVDAPERAQEFGQQARRFLADLVEGSHVDVYPSRFERDGRLVARVSVPRGDLSTLLLRSGFAWHSTEFSNDLLLADAERAAREAKRGLWARPNPIPPWVFRRNTRSQGRGAHAVTVQGPFHANVNSFVFHSRSCPDYNCKNCTRVFTTAAEAVRAGFRPHSACIR